MRDINNIYEINPSGQLDEASFRDEELWKSEHVIDDTRSTRRILNTKYQNYDLSKIVSDSKHLSSDKKSILYDVLSKYEFLFKGTVLTCKKNPLYVELQPVAKPYH